MPILPRPSDAEVHLAKAAAEEARKAARGPPVSVGITLPKVAQPVVDLGEPHGQAYGDRVANYVRKDAQMSRSLLAMEHGTEMGENWQSNCGQAKTGPNNGTVMSMQLSPHQGIFYAHVKNVVRIVSAATASKDGKGDEDWIMRVPRTTLVYHNTGAGKTMISMGIMEAAWDLLRDQGWRVHVITTDSNLRENSLDTYVNRAAGAYRRFHGMTPRAVERLLRTKAHIGNGRYGKGNYEGVTWMSYRVFANALGVGHPKRREREQIDLNHRILIFDEAHNMLPEHFDPKGDSAHMGAIYRALMSDKGHGRANCLIYMLTATPGRTVGELDNLMRLMHTPWDGGRAFDPAEAAAVAAGTSSDNGDGLTKWLAGKVSFVDISGVQTMYPRHELIQRPIQLGAAQRSAVAKLSKGKGHDRRLSRVRGSLMAPRGRANRCKLVGGHSVKATANIMASLESMREKASAKVASVLQFILDPEHPERLASKHVVHAKEYRTIEAMACGLEQLMPSDANTARWISLDAEADMSPGVMTARPRFMFREDGRIRSDTRKHEVRRIAQAYGITDVDDLSKRDNMVEAISRARLGLFNHANNDGGQMVQVLLISGTDAEGLDLVSTEYLHELDAPDNYSAFLQLKGRHQRRCSHRRFADRNRWKAVVVQHFAGKLATDDQVESKEQMSIMYTRITVALEKLREFMVRVGIMLEPAETAGGPTPTERLALTERMGMMEHAMVTLTANGSATKAYIDAEGVDKSTEERLIWENALITQRPMERIYELFRRASFDCKVLAKMHSGAYGQIDCEV